MLTSVKAYRTIVTLLKGLRIISEFIYYKLESYQENRINLSKSFQLALHKLIATFTFE